MVKFHNLFVSFSRAFWYNGFSGRMGRPDSQKVNVMSDSSAVNYTPEMEAKIIAAAPLNLEKSKALAAQIGKSYRSVIAKAKSLGVDYEGKPKAAKRVAGQTKPQIVATIAARVNLPAEKLEGLEKAPALVLGALLDAVGG